MSALRYAPVVVATGLLVLIGCGGVSYSEVGGTVKFGGKPLDKIQVEFWPEVGGGRRSIGETDSEGRYTLTTDDGKQKGAVVGPHRIVLRDSGVLGDKFLGRAAENVDMSKGKKSRIPAQYTDASKTPLRKEVTAGKCEIDLEVTP